MKKKKICILSNGLVRGGTDTFVVNLVRGLDKNKYDITVVLSISDSSLAYRENEIFEVGAKTIWTNSIGYGLKNKIKHLFKLYKILKKGKFDIFQTNIDLFNGPNLFVAWIAKVPIRICHSHNSKQETEERTNKKFLIFIYQKIMKFMCWNFSNRRCGCSELALDFLFDSKWRDDDKARVINNGIDINSFKRNINLSSKRAELGLISNRKYVLTVGRISSQKNPTMIVNIFNDLLKLRNDCDLLWVGIGEMEEEIKNKTSTLGIDERIHFLGSRNDVNEIMRVCDAFLFPSLFEGLGIVIIEAQAAKLPSLISNTIPEQVNCGGCLFKNLTDTSYEWAIELDHILNHEYEFFIDYDKLNQYDISTMVKQMESMF